jgi:sugar phosphate isomerase/epimerase
MKPCLSETLTMTSSFAEDVAAYADAGCEAIEVWLTKLEDHVQQQGIEATRALLETRHLRLAAASYQGGLLLSQGAQRLEMFNQLQRRLDLCQALGIGTLLVVADFVQDVDLTALERARISLKQAAQLAAAFGVSLALEFRSPSRWCSSLDSAAALVEACDERNVGINFDVFHYYTGPSKSEDLALLNQHNLAFVQLCDLSGVPREMARDSDRILPGEGDFQLGPILERLRKIGYDGWISVEAPNPEFWKMKPAQVAATAMMCLRRLL